MSYRKLEHLSANFGNLNLASSRGGQGGGGSGGSSTGSSSPARQWNSNNNNNSNDSNGRQQQQQQQQQHHGQDWQQLESELNAATAKEFVPGRGWRNQHSSASSVGSGNSNSQRKFSSSVWFHVEEFWCVALIFIFNHSNSNLYILFSSLFQQFQQKRMPKFLDPVIDPNSNNSRTSSRTILL